MATGDAGVSLGLEDGDCGGVGGGRSFSFFVSFLAGSEDWAEREASGMKINCQPLRNLYCLAAA